MKVRLERSVQLFGGDVVNVDVLARSEGVVVFQFFGADPSLPKSSVRRVLVGAGEDETTRIAEDLGKMLGIEVAEVIES